MIFRKSGRLRAEQVGKDNLVQTLVMRPLRHPALLAIGLVFYVINAGLVLWEPDRVLRLGVPTRDDVISRIEFTWIDDEATQRARTRAESVASPVFRRVPPDRALEAEVKVLVDAITRHDTLDQAGPLEPWSITADDFAWLSGKLAYGRDQEDSQHRISEGFRTLREDVERLETIDRQTADEIQAFARDWTLSDTGESGIPLARLAVHGAGPEHPRRLEVRLDELVGKRLGNLFGRDDARSFSIVTSLFGSRLKPTLELDDDAFAAARKRARDTIPPVMHEVKANDVILRRGQIPEPRHIGMVDAEAGAFAARPRQEQVVLHLRSNLGRIVVFTLLCGVFMVLVAERDPGVTRNQGRWFSFCLLATAVIASSRLLAFGGHSPLWVPLPLAGEAMQVVHGRRGALLAVFFLGAILGISMEASGVALTLTLGALTAVYCSKEIRSRLTLLGSGLAAGVMMLSAEFAFALQGDGTTGLDELGPLLGDAGVSLANGLLTGMVMTALLPLIEKLFNITTNITWLELGNMNRPLLRRMSVEAPGTWQHSQLLATLSEAACRRIGANALMARVVCYYHDIGKCIKPQYFIENLQGADNPHDKLTPTMSALVIRAHPKDGEELARRHGLPREVTDAILQHHGTTRVEYFYRRAMQECREGEDVSEESFRYPGPRPQYREMGIIMCADSCEGAVRALVQNSSDVNPARIKSEIEKVVRSKMDMGQLDESGLTLSEIVLMVEEFAKVFASFHHQRIKYPKAPGEKDEDEVEEASGLPAS